MSEIDKCKKCRGVGSRIVSYNPFGGNEYEICVECNGTGKDIREILKKIIKLRRKNVELSVQLKELKDKVISLLRDWKPEYPIGPINAADYVKKNLE